MSEMELSIVQQRSLEALEQKARRGELFLNVAIGYLKVSNDRIDKDPDRRIQEALALVFTKFAEMQTPRQVHLCLRQERITLPGGRPCIARRSGSEERGDQDGESVSRRDDDRRDDCRAQEFCLL
ncbi:hypothetical protein [Bradyrhizobium sp. USDA 329]|uniref:hypothetical protein n=1 Tax=unclassified Bradyrhizobium TaxID=2631580 RepID=UPI003518888D